MRLEDKVALITGAASGMGRAAAELFAAEGARVVMVGRRQAQGEEVAGVITARGGDAIFVRADISVENDVRRAVEAAVGKYGKLDILFNNAGINQTAQGRPDEEPTESWDQIMGVNLRGAYLCIKHAVPVRLQSRLRPHLSSGVGEMRKAGGGSIINNSSVLDSPTRRTDDNSSASYHASKGGLTALTMKCAVIYADLHQKSI